MATARRLNGSRLSSVHKDVKVAERADPEAIRTLYADYGPALFGYVLRLLNGDRQQAEDIVQETLLRAWRHPEALDPALGDVRPWLWTVARRLVIDRIRARRSRPHDVAEYVLAGAHIDDDLDRALEAWQIADALRSLTIDHRAVLVQTYYLGRTVAEAAAVLGVPVGTVKSRASYALRELRLLLAEQGVTS
jgi:RNA polymerase sigma-70 factor (ECF subfamily)